MKHIKIFEEFIGEGNTRPLDEFTPNISSFKGAIAYSLKNHKKDGANVGFKLGDEFGFSGSGGIILQRSVGSDFNTVWLSNPKGQKDYKEAEKIADWLKKNGAKLILFGPMVSGFSGSEQDFIDRYL
jgi:hypothetical protein